MVSALQIEGEAWRKQQGWLVNHMLVASSWFYFVDDPNWAIYMR